MSTDVPRSEPTWADLMDELLQESFCRRIRALGDVALDAQRPPSALAHGAVPTEPQADAGALQVRDDALY